MATKTKAKTKAGNKTLDDYAKARKKPARKKKSNVDCKAINANRPTSKRNSTDYKGEGHARTATKSGKTVGGVTYVSGYSRRAWGTADDYSGRYRRGGYRRYPKRK